MIWYEKVRDLYSFGVSYTIYRCESRMFILNAKLLIDEFALIIVRISYIVSLLKYD